MRVPISTTLIWSLWTLTTRSYGKRLLGRKGLSTGRNGFTNYTHGRKKYLTPWRLIEGTLHVRLEVIQIRLQLVRKFLPECFTVPPSDAPIYFRQTRSWTRTPDFGVQAFTYLLLRYSRLLFSSYVQLHPVLGSCTRDFASDSCRLPPLSLVTVVSTILKIFLQNVIRFAHGRCLHNKFQFRQLVGLTSISRTPSTSNYPTWCEKNNWWILRKILVPKLALSDSPSTVQLYLSDRTSSSQRASCFLSVDQSTALICIFCIWSLLYLGSLFCIWSLNK